MTVTEIRDQTPVINFLDQPAGFGKEIGVYLSTQLPNGTEVDEDLTGRRAWLIINPTQPQARQVEMRVEGNGVFWIIDAQCPTPADHAILVEPAPDGVPEIRVRGRITISIRRAL